jgi:hypothetical protein
MTHKEKRAQEDRLPSCADVLADGPAVDSTII